MIDQLNLFRRSAWSCDLLSSGFGMAVIKGMAMAKMPKVTTAMILSQLRGEAVIKCLSNSKSARVGQRVLELFLSCEEIPQQNVF